MIRRPYSSGRRKILFLAAVLGVSNAWVSAGSAARRLALPESAPVAAPNAVEKLEAALGTAKTVKLNFKISSEGAIASSLEGTIELYHGNVAVIDASGTFASQVVALKFLSNGEMMMGGSAEKRFELDTPAGLNDRLIVGLVRLGLLHSLAGLSEGDPPDHADGKVREWVSVDKITEDTQESVDGVKARKLTFNLVVEGKPSGSAELWTDSKTGFPLQRKTTVQFPTGEMRVVERYEMR